MKRSLKGIIAATMVLGTAVPTALAATTSGYTDISGNQYASAIDLMTELGVVHGYTDGSYQPSGFVTRGQAVAYVYNILTAQGKITKHYTLSAQPYSDEQAWARTSMNDMYLYGYLNNMDLGNGAIGLNYHTPAWWLSELLCNVAGVSYDSSSHYSALNAARAQGWWDGTTDKTANPNYYTNRDEMAQVLENFYKAQFPDAFKGIASDLTLSAKDSGIATGVADALTLSGTDVNGDAATLDPSQISYTVTGADGKVSSTGFVNAAGNFTATAPGTYTVTATYGKTDATHPGISASTTITVYGSAVGYTVSAPSTNVVANGVSNTTLTVQAVDANGKPAQNYDGTAAVSISGNAVSIAGSGQASDYSGGKLTFTNGQATVVVTSGSNVGLSSTITVTSNDLKDASGAAVTATTTLTSVAQVATSVSVTSASKYAEANISTADTFSVEVDDQSGAPMLSGAYAVSLSVNGPGKFADGTTGPDTVVFVGDGTAGAPADPTVTVNTQPGQTGTIQVVGAASGLTSGQGSVQAVISGSAAQINASASGTSVTQGSGSITLSIGQADANGYPTSSTEANNYKVTVTNASGTDVSSSFTGTGAVVGTSATITPVTTAALAGTYTVVVSDNNTGGVLKASAPVQFTVAPAAAANYKFTSTAQQVSEANPSTSVQLEAVDAYGNPVNSAVTFNVYGSGGSGTATVNGNTVSATTPVAVASNGSGVATLNFTAQPYANSAWTLTVASVKDANGNTLNLNPSGTAGSDTITVKSTVATQIGTTVENTSLTGNPVDSIGSSGQTFQVVVNAKDQFGNPIGGDSLTITPSSGLDLSGSGLGAAVSGSYTVSSAANLTIPNIVAKGAGVQTIKITDNSAPNTPSTTVSLSITPGTFNGSYAIFDQNGNSLTSNSTASSPDSFPTSGYTVVWVKPTDANGNAVVSTYGDTVNLVSSNTKGQFRTSLNGANISSVSIPSGSAGVELFYLNGASGASSDNLTAVGSPTVTGAVYTTVSSSVYGLTLSGADLSGASIDLSKVTVSGGHNLGAGATVSGDVITLGSGATVAKGDSLTFQAGSITNGAYSNASDVTVSVK